MTTKNDRRTVTHAADTPLAVDAWKQLGTVAFAIADIEHDIATDRVKGDTTFWLHCQAEQLLFQLQAITPSPFVPDLLTGLESAIRDQGLRLCAVLDRGGW